MGRRDVRSRKRASISERGGVRAQTCGWAACSRGCETRCPRRPRPWHRALDSVSCGPRYICIHGTKRPSILPSSVHLGARVPTAIRNSRKPSFSRRQAQRELTFPTAHQTQRQTGSRKAGTKETRARGRQSESILASGEKPRPGKRERKQLSGAGLSAALRFLANPVASGAQATNQTQGKKVLQLSTQAKMLNHPGSHAWVGGGGVWSMGEWGELSRSLKIAGRISNPGRVARLGGASRSLPAPKSLS